MYSSRSLGIPSQIVGQESLQLLANSVASVAIHGGQCHPFWISYGIKYCIACNDHENPQSVVATE